MVRETEMVREVGGRRRYPNKDGDLEINNAPCVIRRYGPNLERF
jgi:hypothetical protein